MAAAKKVTSTTTPTATKRPRRPAAKKVEPKPPSFLQDYIYPAELADTYISRTFPGGVSDFDVLAAQYATRRPVLLQGPTGAGKTILIEAFAAKIGVPLFTLGGSAGTTEADLYGRYVPVILPDGTEKLEWADGPITLAARWGGIGYADEGNFIPPEITAALHSAADARRRIEVKGHAIPYVGDDGVTRYRAESIPVHPDFWFVTAGNVGYNGTSPWNEAFKNRFEIIEIDYDPYVESHLVASHSLIEFAERLRVDVKAGHLFTPVSTVRLISFERNLYELGYDYAVASLLAYFDEDERALVATALEDGFSQRICEDYGVEFLDDDVSDAELPADEDDQA